MKYFILTLLFISSNSQGLCQSDTTIDNLIYTVIERYDNGNAKLVGQYGYGCLDSTKKKHGFFLEFDQNGKEKNRELYFLNQKRNKKILGIKYGWWGWYGITTKYFIGIRTRRYITDPCF